MSIGGSCQTTHKVDGSWFGGENGLYFSMSKRMCHNLANYFRGKLETLLVISESPHVRLD